MFSCRAQPDVPRLQRSALAALFAFMALVAFLVPGKTAQAHGHGHGRSSAAQLPPSSTASMADSAPRENVPADDEPHGHRHSGDPLTDLLTLGHHHVGGAGPALLPTPWCLVASPRITQPAVPWPERIFGDSPRDTPFRPPIA